MPKINPEKAAIRIDKIHNGALELFAAKGFHGVGLRDIAKAAGVSLGNIYNYFDGKEAIFESIIQRLYSDFIHPSQPLSKFLGRCSFPMDAEELGKVAGEMVDLHRDYFTLVYVDIAEFSGKHVRSHFQNLTKIFSAVMAPRFRILKESGGLGVEVEPEAAFTMIYMQFFNFFIVERLIGARGHMGMDEQSAVKAISSIFLNGVAPR